MVKIRPESGFPSWLAEKAAGTLVDHLDFEFVEFRDTTATVEVKARKFHFAPNGYLHGGVVTTIADTVAGIACRALLSKEASGFATIELKTNFLGTAKLGETVRAVASLAHSGRTTQVWDAVISVVERDKVIALFRCTQSIIYSV